MLSEVYANSSNAVAYSGNLGAQLATVARLIKGGLQTKLYLVSLDGFDTHANQINEHPLLLMEVANAIQNFYQDLGISGRAQDVLCMTFSEFGRRMEENGSEGTDHGAAAPMLLFGEGLNGSGFIGLPPSLTDVDVVGNLRYYIDFRQVYASVMEQWLCVNPRTINNILGQVHERLNTGISCDVQTTTNTNDEAIPDTTNVAIPDTTNVAIPDTSSVAIPDTSSVAIPDTSSVVIPDTSSVAIPDTSNIVTTNITSQTIPISILHEPRYDFNGGVFIYYKLSASHHINLTILNSLGQHITTLARARQSAGNYRYPISRHHTNWTKGYLSLIHI